MNQTKKEITLIESNNNSQLNLDVHGCIIHQPSNANQPNPKTESDRKMYLYNRYYSYTDLFGSDSDGNLVIGAIKSPANIQKKKKLIKADLDIDSPLKEVKESDDKMYTGNAKILLLKENERAIQQTVRHNKRRKKRKKQRKNSSISSMEVPIPSKSSLELQLERGAFADHEMFDEEEKDYHQYNADCDEQHECVRNYNYNGHVLALDTDKILKGIKRKHKVVAHNKPSQLYLDKTHKSMEKKKKKINDKYKAMQKELVSWKRQYRQLNEEYNASLERNERVTDKLQIENDALKEKLKKYKRTFECINDEIICIGNKYKLNKREIAIASEEEDNETEVEDERDTLVVLEQIKSRFAGFITGCEGIQQLFNNLQERSKLNVSETVCKRYDEIYKLWMEHVRNGKYAAEYVGNMYEKGVDELDNVSMNVSDEQHDLQNDFEVMMDQNRIKCDFV